MKIASFWNGFVTTDADEWIMDIWKLNENVSYLFIVCACKYFRMDSKKELYYENSSVTVNQMQHPQCTTICVVSP